MDSAEAARAARARATVVAPRVLVDHTNESLKLVIAKFPNFISSNKFSSLMNVNTKTSIERPGHGRQYLKSVGKKISSPLLLIAPCSKLQEILREINPTTFCLSGFKDDKLLKHLCTSGRQ